MHRPNRTATGGLIAVLQARLPWVLAMAATIAALPLLSSTVPVPLVLPLLSVLLVSSGLAVAASAHRAGTAPARDRIGAKDVAGALVLLGFAAAMFSDTELALAAFDQLQTGVVASGPL